MSRFGRKLSNWTANWLDLPQDTLSDTPRLAMIGNRHLIVENHRGIVHFSNELVRLALTNGELEISGSELVIRVIWTEEIRIEGIIRNITYNGTGEMK